MTTSPTRPLAGIVGVLVFVAGVVTCAIGTEARVFFIVGLALVLLGIERIAVSARSYRARTEPVEPPKAGEEDEP